VETGTSKRERVKKEREKRFARRRARHVILLSLDFIYVELLTLPRYIIT